MRKHKIGLNPCRQRLLLTYALLRTCRTATRTIRDPFPQCKYTKFLNYRMVRHVPRALLFKLRQLWGLCIRVLFFIALGIEICQQAVQTVQVYVYINKSRHVTNRIYTLCRSYYLCQTLRVDEYGYVLILIRTCGYELYIWRIGAE